MKILKLESQNFKRLKAVEITPAGNVVTISGKNEQGKSSVLDSIQIALMSLSVAPEQPVRTGADQAVIRLGLGEDAVDLIVTKTFEADGSANLKVESADGKARYSSPQAMLNELVGAIGFDPQAFARGKPADQVAELRRLVPLEVDLEALARADTADYQARRDVNRDGKALVAQLDALPDPGELPEELPDREAIVAKLGAAADHNTAIERERMRREESERIIQRTHLASEGKVAAAADLRAEATRLLEQAEAADRKAREIKAEAEGMAAALAEEPPLAEPIDTDQVREELRAAEEVLGRARIVKNREALQAQVDAKRKESAELTRRMEEREKQRTEALAKAPMPVEELAFAATEDGGVTVLYKGTPFSQASGAAKLRVSTAVAIAANPKLRVALIRDGSLMDEDSLALLAEMAKEHDFQIWLETVGTGGVGIVMEDGAIKGAEAPAPIETSKRRKKADAPSPSEPASNEEPKINLPPADKTEELREVVDSTRPARKTKAERAMGGLFGGDE